MYRIGRDNGEKTWIKYLRITVNSHFKFTLDHEGALLVYVLV